MGYVVKTMFSQKTKTAWYKEDPMLFPQILTLWHLGDTTKLSCAIVKTEPPVPSQTDQTYQDSELTSSWLLPASYVASQHPNQWEEREQKNKRKNETEVIRERGYNGQRNVNIYMYC